MSTVGISESAASALRDLPKRERDRILERLEELEEGRSPADMLTAVQGRDVYALNGDGYRLLVDWVEETDELNILAVHRRGQRETPPA